MYEWICETCGIVCTNSDEAMTHTCEAEDLVSYLKSENTRLRAALEAAPEWFKGMRLAYLRDEQVKWYYGLRDKALKGGKE